MIKHNYSVRQAELKDADSLSDLFAELVGQPSHNSSLKKLIEITAKDANYFVAVACDNKQVIGTAMGVICYDLVGNCKPFLLIENVVVSSRYRGKGIGKLLLTSLEKFGRINDCNYSMLVSSAERTQAHKFYESIGYETHLGFKKILGKD